MANDKRNALAMDGVAAQAKGDLARAEAIYRDLIGRTPKDAVANGLLGALLLQQGNIDEAERHIRISHKADANHPDTNQNLGRILAHRGDIEGALNAYERACAQRPNFALALSGAGACLARLNRLDEAEARLKAALRAEPRLIEALCTLANVVKLQGRLEEAALRYRHAISQHPAAGAIYSDLGFVAKELGFKDRWLRCAERADALAPGAAILKTNLGLARTDSNDFEGAKAAFTEALTLDWAPGAAIGLAQVYEREDNFAEADRLMKDAIARAPQSAEALVHASFVSEHLGRTEEARDLLERCIAIAPDLAQAQLNLSLVLLRGGEFDRGWPLYEARRRIDDRQRVSTFTWPIAEWRGEPLSGKRVIFAREQGLGDQIQFLRYAPLLAAEGALVDVLVDPSLADLARTVAGVRRVLTSPDLEDPAAYDFWLLMMSYPMHRGARFDAADIHAPYLAPPKASIAAWREEIAAFAKGRPAVGLVWAGNKVHVNDRNRSIPLEAFAPLATLQDLAFVSFQKGEPEIAARAGAMGLELLDLGARFQSFTDTASAALALDVLVSVDTSVAHIAGAVGAETWLLLPRNNDWRWLALRTDSPWYPRMRLFRQTEWRMWAPVIEQVADALKARRTALAGAP